MRLLPILLACFLMAGCAGTAPSPAATAVFGEDAEFLAAVQEARQSLPRFIELLSVPAPDRTFAAVKVRFTSPDGTSQDIWVDRVTYDGAKLTGDMGDDIPALKLAFGDPLTVPEADIVDWMIVDGGLLTGGYTIRLAYQRMTPEQKDLFLRDAGYRIE